VGAAFRRAARRRRRAGTRGPARERPSRAPTRRRHPPCRPTGGTRAPTPVPRELQRLEQGRDVRAEELVAGGRSGRPRAWGSGARRWRAPAPVWRGEERVRRLRRLVRPLRRGGGRGEVEQERGAGSVAQRGGGSRARAEAPGSGTRYPGAASAARVSWPNGEAVMEGPARCGDGGLQRLGEVQSEG
jgi:hypothetical protein